MINIQDFLVSSISESYTISKIDLTYSPEFKTIGDNKLVMGTLSVAFIDTNEIAKERVNLFPSDISSYYYSIATGTEEEKSNFANTKTIELFEGLNNGDESLAINLVLAKYNLNIEN